MYNKSVLIIKSGCYFIFIRKNNEIFSIISLYIGESKNYGWFILLERGTFVFIYKNYIKYNNNNNKINQLINIFETRTIILLNYIGDYFEL